MVVFRSGVSDSPFQPVNWSQGNGGQGGERQILKESTVNADGPCSGQFKDSFSKREFLNVYKPCLKIWLETQEQERRGGLFCSKSRAGLEGGGCWPNCIQREQEADFK